ncbi:MAG: YdbL family protein [Alphaproteobacteria bacterium]|nr:YdbL family protein [Alphaproteobacteria bacterium]MBU2269935.1 YdbL family protein [Alphaproteobacteria bacterium]MBU2418900.1 YdbL family protein [Alphaproteobacteria bacterium]
MRKSLPMFSFRKLFVITAAVAALGVAAGAAFAQTAGQKAMIDAAKAQGAVGEQADGYLGFRQPSSDPALTQAVTVTNSARREAYANTARTAGTTTEVAAARAFETIVLPRVSSGQWYRNAQGQWVQR